MNELCSRSAIELAAMIRSREVSSREVVDAHLARIEEINPAVNAITVVLADQARAAADSADSLPPAGPLYGVPITVKENIDLLGTPTTSGLTVLAEALPTANAPIVDRMLAAGAIPIGRTNLPELGLRIDTSNRLRGRTGNAWDPALTPGGSSGGEGSALGARMSPLGLGNDIGGSLRAPAFCNGVVGMRPTMHRVPHAATIEPVDGALCGQMMATDGPMARTVAGIDAGQAAAAIACAGTPQITATLQRVAAVRFHYPAEATTVGEIRIDEALLPESVVLAAPLAGAGVELVPPPEGHVWSRYAMTVAVGESARECESALDEAERAVELRSAEQVHAAEGAGQESGV